MSRKTQKKLRKLLTLVSCAVLLVCVTIGATVAYLTSQDKVVNTFTVGKVGITLDEAKVDAYGDPVVDDDGNPVKRVQANEYKLVPDHTYAKDPIIHVASDSENAILFVKLENGISDIEATSDANYSRIVDQMTAKGWKPVTGKPGIYYYRSVVTANANITVFEKFKIANNADVANYATEKDAQGNVQNTATKLIRVTAYAVQADGFVSSTATGTLVKDDEAAGAWSAAGLN